MEALRQEFTEAMERKKGTAQLRTRRRHPVHAWPIGDVDAVPDKAGCTNRQQRHGKTVEEFNPSPEEQHAVPDATKDRGLGPVHDGD